MTKWQFLYKLSFRINIKWAGKRLHLSIVGNGSQTGFHYVSTAALQLLFDETQFRLDRIGGEALYRCAFPPTRAHKLEQGAQMGFPCLQRFGTTGGVLRGSVHSADPWALFKQPTHVGCLRWAGRYKASTSCTLYRTERSDRSLQSQLLKFSPCSGTLSLSSATGSRSIIRRAAQSCPPTSSKA